MDLQFAIMGVDRIRDDEHLGTVVRRMKWCGLSGSEQTKTFEESSYLATVRACVKGKN
jgi:hypothetical protein